MKEAKQGSLFFVERSWCWCCL